MVTITFSTILLGLAMTLDSFAQVDTTTIVNIPVIVHIVDDSRKSKCFEPGANPDQNLDRGLIESEIADLHRDFLLLNVDTAQVLPLYKHLIANARINFFLDTTFNRSAAERGIIRVKSKEFATIASPIIDRTKYLNVYVVNIKNSYTVNDHVWDSPDVDCIFLYYCWVGKGYRLLTHEAGHWLGLLHLWGTGGAKGDRNSCAVGDSLNDTHPQRNATDGACDHCPSDGSGTKDQSCDGQPSNYHNFMDYSGCRKMFTRDQVMLMRSNLYKYRTRLTEIK